MIKKKKTILDSCKLLWYTHRYLLKNVVRCSQVSFRTYQLARLANLSEEQNLHLHLWLQHSSSPKPKGRESTDNTVSTSLEAKSAIQSKTLPSSVDRPLWLDSLHGMYYCAFLWWPRCRHSSLVIAILWDYTLLLPMGTHWIGRVALSHLWIGRESLSYDINLNI